jgi:hypothetical protein
MVEQWTHKPLVLGSNPSLAIFVLIDRQLSYSLPALKL